MFMVKDMLGMKVKLKVYRKNVGKKQTNNDLEQNK